jgi:hypothetical protein
MLKNAEITSECDFRECWGLFWAHLGIYLGVLWESFWGLLGALGPSWCDFWALETHAKFHVFSESLQKPIDAARRQDGVLDRLEAPTWVSPL